MPDLKDLLLSPHCTTYGGCLWKDSRWWCWKGESSDYPAVAPASSEQRRHRCHARHAERCWVKSWRLKKNPSLRLHTDPRWHTFTGTEKGVRNYPDPPGLEPLLLLFLWCLAVGWRVLTEGCSSVLSHLPWPVCVLFHGLYAQPHYAYLPWFYDQYRSRRFHYRRKQHRHFKLKYLSFRQTALCRNEVGKLTILAIHPSWRQCCLWLLFPSYKDPWSWYLVLPLPWSFPHRCLDADPYLGYIFLKHKDDKQQESKEGNRMEDYDITPNPSV